MGQNSSRSQYSPQLQFQKLQSHKRYLSLDVFKSTDQQNLNMQTVLKSKFANAFNSSRYSTKSQSFRSPNSFRITNKFFSPQNTSKSTSSQKNKLYDPKDREFITKQCVKRLKDTQNDLINIMYSRDVEFTKDNSEYKRNQNPAQKESKKLKQIQIDCDRTPFIDDLKATKTTLQLRKSVRKMKLHQTAKEVHDKFLANNYEYLKKKTIQRQNIQQTIRKVINAQKFEKAAKEKQDIKLKNYNQCFREENFNSNYLYNNLPKQDNTDEMRIVVNKNELMKRKKQQNQGLQSKRSIIVLNDDEKRENHRRYALKNFSTIITGLTNN